MLYEISDPSASWTNYNRDEILGVRYGEEPPTDDPKGTDAWYFDNKGVGDKIDWHYYTELANPDHTYGDIISQYWVVRPDGDVGPYLAIYSKRQPGGGNHSGTYRSRWLWMLPPGGFTPGEWIVAYRGNPPDPSVLPNLPRVQLQYDPFDGAGPRQDDEEIIYQVISSSSGAAEGTVSSATALAAIELTSGKYYYTFMLSGD